MSPRADPTVGNCPRAVWLRTWVPVGVIDGGDVFEGDPGGLPFLLLVITVRRFGWAAALP